MSGKIAEIAVRDVIHDRVVKNKAALAILKRWISFSLSRYCSDWHQRLAKIKLLELAIPKLNISDRRSPVTIVILGVDYVVPSKATNRFA